MTSINNLERRLEDKIVALDKLVLSLKLADNELADEINENNRDSLGTIGVILGGISMVISIIQGAVGLKRGYSG